jgi:hypothetical protein
MTNLGEKQSTEPTEVDIKKSPKISYPSLTIRDKSLEAAFGKELPQVGEELEATLTLKVCGVSSDEYGKMVTFDVTSGDFSDPEMADGKKEKPEPGEKVGGKEGMGESAKMGKMGGADSEASDY